MLVAVLFGAVPILVTRPAPLQDWPNHVARIHILVGLLQHDPFWTRFYVLTGFLVPNAVLDLGLLGLFRTGISPQAAAQIFLLATYLVFVSGFCALAKAFRALGPGKPALAILLFYNNALFWGFVSYMLGVGLMLGLLACWLTAADSIRRRVLVATCGAVILLFTHLVVAAVWAFILGCFDLSHRWRRPAATGRVTGDASSLAAFGTIAALLYALPSCMGDEFSLHYAGVSGAGFILHKFRAFADILLGGSRVQDASSLGALAVCLVVVCFGRPRLAAAPAITAAGLVLLVTTAPERLGTGSQLDTRLAILPLLVVAAAIRVHARRGALQALAAAVTMRALVLAVVWHASGLVFLDYRRQTANLPSGSMMLMAYGTKLSTLRWRQIWSPPITSIATQVVFRDLFVPSIFANPAEQPIALRAGYRALNQPINLSDAAHRRAANQALASLCANHHFPDIFLTVLYPGDVATHLGGSALVRAGPHFLILDVCGDSR